MLNVDFEGANSSAPLEAISIGDIDMKARTIACLSFLFVVIAATFSLNVRFGV